MDRNGFGGSRHRLYGQSGAFAVQGLADETHGAERRHLAEPGGIARAAIYGQRDRCRFGRLQPLLRQIHFRQRGQYDHQSQRRNPHVLPGHGI